MVGNQIARDQAKFKNIFGQPTLQTGNRYVYQTGINDYTSANNNDQGDYSSNGGGFSFNNPSYSITVDYGSAMDTSTFNDAGDLGGSDDTWNWFWSDGGW